MVLIVWNGIDDDGDYDNNDGKKMVMIMMMVYIVWEEAIGRRGVVSPADTQRVPHPPRGAL